MICRLSILFKDRDQMVAFFEDVLRPALDSTAKAGKMAVRHAEGVHLAGYDDFFVWDTGDPEAEYLLETLPEGEKVEVS